jgi:UDP-GlcNAc3NAcA epimerase
MPNNTKNQSAGKIISLIGARPQFIKEAIIHQELQKVNIDEIIVNSGQHYDSNMSDIFFEKLAIKKPAYNLCIGSGSHGEMTGRIMIEFEKVVNEIKPQMILIYGDTNTTLAGAIVGAKLKIPVAHIEAGVRMLPKDMPEEINRTLADRVSTLLFAASQRCVENLKLEGITHGVHFTGDVMYDVFLKFKPEFRYDILKELELEANQYIVLTLHRDYNVDSKNNLEKILNQIQEASNYNRIIFPIHPRTKKKVHEFGLESYLNKVVVIDPIDYLNLMGLVCKSKLVITDSGGLQKEAYFAGKQALLFMLDPAWHELEEAGINKLVGENKLQKLIESCNKQEFQPGIYGDGSASRKIVELIRLLLC